MIPSPAFVDVGEALFAEQIVLVVVTNKQGESMATLFSEASQAVVFSVLGISTLSEVLDKDFQDITPTQDIIRDKVSGLYADRNRGSVRLNSGRFYTAAEFDARIDRVSALNLP